MWIPDIRPDAGLLVGAAVAVAAASPALAADNYVLGRCATATQSRGADIRPTYAAGGYLVDYHGNDPRYKEKLSRGEFFAGAKVTLVKAPAHGKVFLEDDSDAASRNRYHYWPQAGYVGRDRFVMQVEKDGVKVRIQYLIEGLDEEEAGTGICNPESWKISSSFTTPVLDNANLQAMLDTTGIGSGVTLEAADLPGGVVGQTTDTTITLDANVAGYGWFVDTTPRIKGILPFGKSSVPFVPEL